MPNKKGANPQESSIVIRLDSSLKEELQYYSELYKRNTSELVREAISTWLNLQPKKE
jgi:predicted DNA-binding protein